MGGGRWGVSVEADWASSGRSPREKANFWGLHLANFCDVGLVIDAITEERTEVPKRALEAIGDGFLLALRSQCEGGNATQPSATTDPSGRPQSTATCG